LSIRSYSLQGCEQGGEKQRFINSREFQTLTWLRIVGGSLFIVGGVIPLVWFIVSRRKSLKAGQSPILGRRLKTKNLQPLRCND